MANLAQEGDCSPFDHFISRSHLARLTSQLIQNAIQAGISYIGVHGRTRWQRDTEPVNLPGIRFAVEEARGAVSMIANGDCFRYSDSERARLETGANAVMSARGLLENPALFAGYEKTPLEAIEVHTGCELVPKVSNADATLS